MPKQETSLSLCIVWQQFLGLYPYALPTGFVGCAARAHAIRSVDFCRQFYKTYPKGNALRSQLNWSQYRMLIQISDPDKREYYELEAVNEGWTGRQLERQKQLFMLQQENKDKED